MSNKEEIYSMEIDNKIFLDKLQKYFMTQDREIVAQLCANFALDLSRFLYIEDMEKKDKDHLIHRTKNNVSNMYALYKLEETGLADASSIVIRK